MKGKSRNLSPGQRFLSAMLLALALSVSTSSAAEKHPKKLIEFGWDEPDTAFLKTHIGEMRQTPFDGCVFHANYQRTNGAKGSFTWEAWGQQMFTKSDLAGALADLKATRFGRFKENFLRLNTTPARIDWFDDHAAVLANAKLAAQLARAGRCPGILFDIEQYEGPLFNYRKHGWNTEDFSGNYFSPEALATSVREALRHADEYVWVYSETPRWWSEKGPVKLPAAYDQALRQAREWAIP